MNRIDEIEKITERFMAELSEYCDSAHISISYEDSQDASTVSKHGGFGNWFSRMGLVHDFLDREKANTHWRTKQELDED